MPTIHPPQLVVVDQGTAEFKRHPRDYARACQEQVHPLGFLEIAGRNHFDIILYWLQAISTLTRSGLSLAQPMD